MPRGGARPNSGPKPPGYVPPEGREDFELWRGYHEKIKAEQREFKLSVERGEYLKRDSVRQASATAQAVVAQSLRSLSDNLERKFNLSPEIAGAISAEVDASLLELANTMKAMSGDE